MQLFYLFAHFWQLKTFQIISFENLEFFGQISPVGKGLLNVHAHNVNVFQELSKMCFQNPALILAILVLFPNDSNILFSKSNFRFLFKSLCA